jgi:Nif-specific regulatory protein
MKKTKPKVSLTKKDFALLYEVSNSIHAINNLNDMLNHIFQEIRNVFDIEGVSIALHDAKKREFYFIRTVEHGVGEPAASPVAMRFSDQKGIGSWVMRERQTTVVHDVYKDKRFFKGMDSKGKFKTKSMICAPLKTRRRIIGVLYALNKLSGKFTERETKLFEVLSGSIAIAVENAQLYGELSQYVYRLEDENRRLKSGGLERFRVQGVIGSSAAMRDVFSLVNKVVGNKTPVLLLGETGTGKELIARVIHFTGILKDQPFVVENCGALTESLLASELFGHVKGAFTGAESNKKGLFELADGGTVFLDEIGETSPSMQVKLLRAIQEGQIRPVGAEQTNDVDVRVIVSTNRDLEEEVASGRFRKDLFYRVNVFPITMPPLRDRTEDIPLLVDHFLKLTSDRFGVKLKSIHHNTMTLLLNYHWPGNVRQLENEIERAVALVGDKKVIRPEHLSSDVNPWAAQECAPIGRDEKLRDVVERIERQMIQNALTKTNSNRTKSAAMLGLTRQGLINKLHRYGMM